MAEPAPIRAESEGGVLRITLNRPKARNAMSAAMVGALITTLDEAERSDEVRVIVLRGAGGHFCAGGDIKDMARARSVTGSTNGDGNDDGVKALSAKFGQVALRFARTELATVAVLEGAVMGGGFGLACTVDVAIASSSVDFRLPETSLGVVPAQIAPFLLERLGYSEAKRLSVTGARLNSAQAERAGLVHHVCAPDELDAKVNEVLARILRCAPQATATTKRLLHALHTGVGDAEIDHAADVFSKAARSDEAAQGIQAFLTKSSPPWAPKK